MGRLVIIRLENIINIPKMDIKQNILIILINSFAAYTILTIDKF